jgi:hypothetical protein
MVVSSNMSAGALLWGRLMDKSGGCINGNPSGCLDQKSGSAALSQVFELQIVFDAAHP